MLKEADPEFAKQSKYFAELADKMGTMERIASRLHNERESLHEVQEDLSVSVFQWAANENALTQTLQKLASCVEKCNTALKDLVCVCVCVHLCVCVCVCVCVCMHAYITCSVHVCVQYTKDDGTIFCSYLYY